MSLWDYLAPAITGRLTSLQLGEQRIEERLAELSNQLTAQGDELMRSIEELKDLVNNKSQARLSPPAEE